MGVIRVEVAPGKLVSFRTPIAQLIYIVPNKLTAYKCGKGYCLHSLWAKKLAGS